MSFKAEARRLRYAKAAADEAPLPHSKLCDRVWSAAATFHQPPSLRPVATMKIDAVSVYDEF
jgi:hypothetical protein